jgi:basic membrane lipoprotein Med (substrate-binding protein (PBP1-ABC) superfamily)
MQNVKVWLPAADLSQEMAAMREWLDSNRYEPAKFNCEQDGADVVISVDFMLDEAAEAFASRFVAEPGPRGSTPSARDSSRRSAT